MTMTPQRYIVQHETRYAYTAPVSQSWQLARLTPRMLPWQTLLSYTLERKQRKVAREYRRLVQEYSQLPISSSKFPILTA